MDLLPDPDEREALIAALAHLAERQGEDRFLQAPLIEPTLECFPDRWTADDAGVRTLALRLLDYAGLHDLGADVTIYRNEPQVEELSIEGKPAKWTSHPDSAAAWFAGIDDGVCLFGAAEDGLDAPDLIVGSMCHEIAHVFRHVHGLVEDDKKVEERLTDLTTVWLGFGVITTNAAYQYRQGGGASMIRWSHKRRGYLSFQAMSYLLAVHAVARAADGSERKRIKRMLEPTQAACFAAACKVLDLDHTALGMALGMNIKAAPTRPSLFRRLLGRA